MWGPSTARCVRYLRAATAQQRSSTRRGFACNVSCPMCACKLGAADAMRERLHAHTYAEPGRRRPEKWRAMACGLML
eukprot:352821-Chlamydomonas_euryale.AAC.8